jgi:hypothetical protein
MFINSPVDTVSCHLKNSKTQRKLTDESDLAWVVVQNTTIKTRSISREMGGGGVPVTSSRQDAPPSPDSPI